MNNEAKMICPRCRSNAFSTHLVKNKTKRRSIKAMASLIIIAALGLIMAYINRDYSIIEGALLGAILGVPVAIVTVLIMSIVFRFIPEKYDTIFICQNCGAQIRK